MRATFPLTLVMLYGCGGVGDPDAAAGQAAQRGPVGKPTAAAPSPIHHIFIIVKENRDTAARDLASAFDFTQRPRPSSDFRF